MRVDPEFGPFAAHYDQSEPQALTTRLIADLETPVSAMLKLAEGRPMSVLLESVEGGQSRGRYSIIGLKPDLLLKIEGDKAFLNDRARIDQDAFEPLSHTPLEALRTAVAGCRLALPEGVPPMAVGLFGYMTYDTVRLMENLPVPKHDPVGVPDALFLRPTVTVVFDSVTGEVIVTTPVWPQPGVSPRAAYDRALERLADVVHDLSRALPRQDLGEIPAALPQPQSNMTQAEYHAAVERAKEYIRAGDVFQVVPSQRFAIPFPLPPFSLYRALRRLNPSPYLFHLDLGDFALVGSSPEILVRLQDGTVTIRPIAGTAKRGRTAEEDRLYAERLLNDAKERAEHLMLLDLGRNDVGRVADVGSVEVTDQFIIEHYSHVMHIVSNVEGQLSDAHDAVSALCAGFPAGTVSGAPKIRAMEIINELEPEKRGVYAGMVGYFASDGSMDNCIALRTAVVKEHTVYVQAGGGVVADSDPESEYQESLNKASALFRAAQEAYRFAPTVHRRSIAE